MKSNDERLMQMAINLALRGRGYVNPNPMVGAIIVRDNQIIGEGWHEKYGSNHAEINAILDANESNYSDCTMYVTLEPCSHFGKTPPCVDKIIELGFKKVVIGTQDPNPAISGTGIKKLMDAGVKLELNVLKEKCDWLNRTYFKYITQNKPYIMLKIAQSLDGCIATSKGESRWISGIESRLIAHKLRASVDAVIIGRGTAQNDNPKLNVREIVGRDPRRVVFDTNLSLPLHLNLLRDENRQNTIIFCSPKAAATSKANTLRVTGVNVEPIELAENGNLNIEKALEILKDKFLVYSVMVEGGSTLLSNFVKLNLVDEIQTFIAPKIMGNGIKAFGSFDLKYLKDVPEFDIKSIKKAGNDIHLVAIKNDPKPSN